MAEVVAARGTNSVWQQYHQGLQEQEAREPGLFEQIRRLKLERECLK